ncbi:MAG: MFS transporter, partial [Sphingomonadales bacterium]
LPSQIDDLYEPGDPRVGWAYNVYYVGVNIGGFLAPLICGTLGEVYGWHYGFGAAGVGMIAGLLIYLWGGRYLPQEAGPQRSNSAATRGAMSLGRSTITLLIAVALGVTIFRGAYEQVGNTVALWTDSGVDRRIAGFTVPITWFISLNPLLVMVLTPLLLARWRRRAEAGRTWPAVRKMAAGALIVAAAYLLLATAASLGASGGRTGWPWLIAFFVLFTLGELYILPTGLGLFARVAPAGLGATTVAAWYLAIFTGSLAAGLVGTLWSAMAPGAYFLLLAGIAGAAALLLRALEPLERRRETENDATRKSL